MHRIDLKDAEQGSNNVLIRFHLPDGCTTVLALETTMSMAEVHNSVEKKKGLIPSQYSMSVIYKNGAVETANPIRSLDSYVDLDHINIDKKGEPHVL